VQLPFALIPVLAFNASETLMGKFVNSRGMIGCTVAISLVVMFVNVSGVLAFFEAALSGASVYAWAGLGVAVALYLLFVGYLFLHATAAAGLLPPILGFVAQQPGGASRDSVGGGVFVQLPQEDDSSQGGGDEETGPTGPTGLTGLTGVDYIQAVPSPSGIPPAGDGVEVLADSSKQLDSPGAAAWFSSTESSSSGLSTGSAVGTDEEQQQQQQLVQPLLPHGQQ
jgi:hypothetical protein